jgi:sulfate transport system ATP-binding protein
MSIEVRNITKQFGTVSALSDVSLRIETGELMALLGPSGSGKTTLLRIIAGLDYAEAGQVHFDGEDATRLSVGKRRVGFVFQQYALFRHMSVFENIAFGLKVRPRSQRPARSEIASRVRELLKMVQLDHLEDRFPLQLSGGQRQRVALARALAIEPRVLLLDEPFGALDARVRKDLRRWIRRLHHELQITTIFVTHDQEEALEIADRVVVMNHSRIEQVGTPQEVYDQPVNAFVCQFLGSVNSVKGDAEGLTFVRPHDVEVLNQRNGAPSREAIVEYIHAAGAVARMDLRLKDTGELLEVEMPRSHHAELALKAGDSAFVKFRAVREYAPE